MVRTTMKTLALATLLAAPALARVAQPQRAEAGLAARGYPDCEDGSCEIPDCTEDGTCSEPDCHADNSCPTEEWDCHDDNSCPTEEWDCHEDNSCPTEEWDCHDDNSCEEPEWDCHEDNSCPEPTPAPVWGNYNDHCNPTYDVYECDKGNGKWDYTTLTIYPTDCPNYHEPTALPQWEGWVHYDPSHPKPTQAWGSYDDHHYGKAPEGWYEWDPSWGPKPATWDDWKHAPATTWSVWDPKPTDWSNYAHPPAGWYEWDWSKGPKPEHWDDWKYVTVVKGDEYDWENYGKDYYYGEKDGKKYVIITIVEVYKVPSKDGWVDKTTTLYTTHCGCAETPVPKTPEYVTLTTVCPDDWKVDDKTVTYVTPTCSWTPDAASTWLNVAVKTPVADASTWATYDPKTPVADASTTWATAAIKTPAVATPTQWAGVQKWQGAASSVVISKVMVGGAGMVAALAYFL